MIDALLSTHLASGDDMCSDRGLIQSTPLAPVDLLCVEPWLWSCASADQRWSFCQPTRKALPSSRPEWQCDTVGEFQRSVHVHNDKYEL